MNLNPSSIARKVSDKLGVKGVVAGTILTTAVLEFGSQFIENASFTPSTVKNIADRQIMAGAPFLGRIDVRDAVVLSPSIFLVLIPFFPTEHLKIKSSFHKKSYLLVINQE